MVCQSASPLLVSASGAMNVTVYVYGSDHVSDAIRENLRGAGLTITDNATAATTVILNLLEPSITYNAGIDLRRSLQNQRVIAIAHMTPSADILRIERMFESILDDRNGTIVRTGYLHGSDFVDSRLVPLFEALYRGTRIIVSGDEPNKGVPIGHIDGVVALVRDITTGTHGDPGRVMAVDQTVYPIHAFIQAVQSATGSQLTDDKAVSLAAFELDLVSCDTPASEAGSQMAETLVASFVRSVKVRPVCIAVLGPPSSGRSFLANRIAARLRIPIINLGDVTSDAIAFGSDPGSTTDGDDALFYSSVFAAWEQVKAPPVVKGKPKNPKVRYRPRLPDDMVAGIVNRRLARSDCRFHGFVLDGYPKSPSDVTSLPYQLGLVVTIDATLEECRARLVRDGGPAHNTDAELERRFTEWMERKCPLTDALADRVTLAVRSDGESLRTVDEHVVEVAARRLALLDPPMVDRVSVQSFIDSSARSPGGLAHDNPAYDPAAGRVQTRADQFKQRLEFLVPIIVDAIKSVPDENSADPLVAFSDYLLASASA